GVPLCEEVVLEPLQAADRLAREPTYLCQLPADRCGLGPDALADGVLDPARQSRLELRRELRERLHLGPCPLERRVHVARRGSLIARLLQACSCACHRCFVHGWEASVRVG